MILLNTFKLNVIALQIPKEVPKPHNNSPIDISNPADIVLYIVLPVAALLLYLLWRRRKNRLKNEKEA